MCYQEPQNLNAKDYLKIKNAKIISFGNAIQNTDFHIFENNGNSL
jgi:hypothetical protein